MTIPASVVASYAPWGNARLAFEVGGTTLSTDSATGNKVQSTELVEYLAALDHPSSRLERPARRGQLHLRMLRPAPQPSSPRSSDHQRQPG
jgi:hypothetical protein